MSEVCYRFYFIVDDFEDQREKGIFLCYIVVKGQSQDLNADLGSFKVYFLRY